ncbi:ribonuclease domain-containing protein [Streptosporangium sp. CA-135522]|uniref:ribonuclease domain-containing protein n=1 Tax=Streptosporangium sp. CA-135522 TaxID=3240072 RepID=UPI003D8BC80E
MKSQGVAATLAAMTLAAVTLLSGCSPAGSSARPGTGSGIGSDVRPTASAGSGGRSTTSARPAVTPRPDARGALPVRALSALPPEAATTWRLIRDGGPFPYPRDGVVFQNRERVLPIRARGYYHEYTVPTPRRSDRGARRLVSGDGAGELYYTGDHYRSFVTVDVRR